MSQATIMALVNQFSNGGADATSLGLYYDRLVQDLARAPWFVSATVIPLTAGTATYTLDETHIKMLGVFYDNRSLDRVDHRMLESMAANWRDHTGEPVAYTVEDEASKTYRLYPKPDKPSGAFIFIYGAPLGLDYPSYAVLLLHTQLRPDMPEWMDLPAAWSLMEREYGHESRHRDDALADFSKSLADLLWSMVG